VADVIQSPQHRRGKSHQLNLLGAVVRLHHGQDDAVGTLPGDPHGGRIIGHDVLEHAQAGLAHVRAVQVCQHCGQQSRYAALPDEELDMRRMAGEGDEHLQRRHKHRLGLQVREHAAQQDGHPVLLGQELRILRAAGDIAERVQQGSEEHGVRAGQRELLADGIQQAGQPALQPRDDGDQLRVKLAEVTEQGERRFKQRGQLSRRLDGHKGGVDGPDRAQDRARAVAARGGEEGIARGLARVVRLGNALQRDRES